MQESKPFPFDIIIGGGSQQRRIQKKLFTRIVPQQLTPSPLLHQSNDLTKILKQQCQKYIDQACKLYSQSNEFYIMKNGCYCAISHSGTQILLFQKYIVSYLILDGSKWVGFSYKIGQNVYMGDFEEIYAEGKGKAVHFQDPNKDIIYEGIWKQGEIEKGKARIFQKGKKQHYIEYDGEFKNFMFHGVGVRTKNGVTIEAYFKDGVKIKQKKSQYKNNRSNQRMMQQEN